MKTKQKRPSKAFSYLRFSSPQQAAGSSLHRQDGAADWAKRKGVRLDDTLTLRDLGVSAWKGRNAAEGNLSTFLDAIKSGHVLPGDFLVIEKIDRLTRQRVRNALNLWCDIIEAGVTIVTLRDGQEYGAESLADNSRLLFPLIEMMQANQFSENLSGMIKGSWRKRRAEAGKRKICRQGPCWLVNNKDMTAFSFRPERVRIVLRLVKLASEGQGLLTICRTMQAEKVPALGRTGKWHQGTIHNILTEQALYGSMQPRQRDKDGRSVPIGEPIRDYYPAIMTEDEFLVLQGKLRQRRAWRGPRGRQVVNLFSGLAWHEGGSRMWLHSGKEQGKQIWIPKAAIDGEIPYVRIRYSLFERRFLELVTELDPAALSPIKGKRPDKLAGLQARYDGREALRQKLADALETADVATVAAKLAEVEAEIATLRRQLDEARATERDTPDLEQTKAIVKLLAECPEAEREALRLRLKSHIASLVERILLDKVQEEEDLTPFVRAEVHFKGGGVRTLRYLVTGRDKGASEKATAEQLEKFAEWQPS